MRSVKLIRVICLLATLLAPGYSSATIQPCPNCPEISPPEITYDQIKAVFFDGDYDYATELVYDYAMQELVKALNDPKKVQKAYNSLVGFLKDILEDPTLTDSQKGEKILVEIEKTMSEYKSQNYGALNLSFSHSIPYGVTRLTWDNNVEVDECSGEFCGWTCLQWNGPDCEDYYWSCSAWVDYVKKVPDYYLYRIINGQEKLITKLHGSQEVHRESISFSPNIYKTIKSLVTADYNYNFDVGDDKAFYQDLRSDLRELGTTLEYKVVSDNSPYKYGACGSSEQYQTTAFVDSDGDGLVDFIPYSEYAKYNVAAWLVPVLNILLQ